MSYIFECPDRSLLKYYTRIQTSIWSLNTMTYCTIVLHENTSNWRMENVFNGGWAVLKNLDWLINWLIDLEKIRVNFLVFLECAHLAYLTRVIFMEDHLKFWLSYSFEWPDRSLLQGRQTSKWSFKTMSWTYRAMVFHENIYLRNF